MNIAEIRRLVETYDDHVLQGAESDIMDGKPLSIVVAGADAAEQLTHILAALWVVQHMKATDDDVADALRAYVERVRRSVS